MIKANDIAEPIHFEFFRRVPEIDTLRGIAVLGVIFNHLGFLQGGFAGVDIFFAISGYVITLQLLRSFSDNTFSISKFYYNRISRILPPLLVVSVFVFVAVQALFIEDTDYSFIKTSFPYQALFAQNVFFTTVASEYFKGLASAKLNLHTWSLAVEEQFYILYPALFAAALKLSGRKWALPLLCSVAFVLFVEGTIHFNDTVAPFIARHLGYEPSKPLVNAIGFYLLPLRAWELLAGVASCLATYKMFKSSPHVLTSLLLARLASSMALVAIVASLILVKESMSWPSISAIPLVLSSCTLLTAIHLRGSMDWEPLLANRVLRIVGRSSYSLYLWHWPILGILVYTNSDFGASPLDYLAYFGLVGLCSAFSYGVVERARSRISPSGAVAVFVIFSAFSIIAGFVSNGLWNGIPEVATIKESGAYDPRPCASCVRSPSGPFVVLWGDSHSQMLVRTLEAICADTDIQLVHLRSNLAADQKDLLDLKQNPNFIAAILVNRWSMYAVGFPSYEPEETGHRYLPYKGRPARNADEALRNFKANVNDLIEELADKPVVIVNQVPQFPFFPKKEAFMEWAGLKLRELPRKTLADHKVDHQVVNEIFSDLSRRHANVRIVDPAQILCNSGECVWREGWRVLYKDDDHLSLAGAEKMRPLLAETISGLASCLPIHNGNEPAPLRVADCSTRNNAVAQETLPNGN